MSFFSEKISLITKAAAKLLHNLFSTPEKKPRFVIHPQNAPRTINYVEDFPAEFNEFEYAGATIETVNCRKNDGAIIRRPAIVALMKRKYLAGDTFVEEDMTASVRDLKAFIDPVSGERGHKNAASIEAALQIFYETKVYPAQQERPGSQQPQKPVKKNRRTTDRSRPCVTASIEASNQEQLFTATDALSPPKAKELFNAI